MDISNKEGKIEKKKFSIILFDTSGQEKFRAFTYSYLCSYNAFLIIYDITDRSSFDNAILRIISIKDSLGLKKDDLRYTLILIGNKLDLVEEDLEEREVFEDEAKQICEENDVIWGGELSTKNLDLEGLYKLFEKFVLEIYNRVGETSPQTQRKKKLTKGKIYRIKKDGGFISEEKNINKIAEEKKSRIKKNSSPSDDSDI